MKKLLLLGLTAVLGCAAMQAGELEVKSVFEVNGIKYQVTSDVFDRVRVMPKWSNVLKYTLYEGDIVIPETVTDPIYGDEYTVTAIANEAFCSYVYVHGPFNENSNKAYAKITSVKLPDTIDSIGASAFEHQDKITSLNIPANLRYIGGYAFAEVQFTEAHIPNSVESVGAYAFAYCGKMTKCDYTHNPKVNNVPMGCFSACGSLRKITLGDNVEYINGTAFMSCKKMTSMIIGKHLLKVALNAFANVSALQLVTLYTEFPPFMQWKVKSGSNFIAANFPLDVYKNCILRVPSWCINDYKQWDIRKGMDHSTGLENTSEDYTTNAWCHMNTIEAIPNYTEEDAQGDSPAGGATGIKDITSDEPLLNAPVEYYNLQGQRVVNPQPGTLVIRRQGRQATKVIM